VIRRMAVIVPAADEEEHIGDCLAAIRAAVSYLHHGTGIAARVILVLDRCRDQTAAIAGRSAGVELITASARNVGAARRAGAARALAGSWPASELWLASTDADSQVPARWLSRMLADARAGAHLVLGTVIPGAGLGAAGRRDWDGRHQLRDGHPHVHGANLGIRGDAYLALGGWPALPTGEDAELARRATAAGHVRISRTAAIPVVTSTRRAGRAPRGFSGYLRELGSGHAERAAVPACGQ
jgi:glycosyltransferase involved in cell wall biosynthesis